MGAVLFGLSIGSMSGILCSAAGETIWHAQSDPALPCHVCGHWDNYPQRGALAAFRPGFSHLVQPCLAPVWRAENVAINVEGAAVEREMNKTVLLMMHGFTPGTLAGAGVRMMLTAFSVPANAHILLAALVAITLSLSPSKQFLTAHG